MTRLQSIAFWLAVTALALSFFSLGFSIGRASEKNRAESLTPLASEVASSAEPTAETAPAAVAPSTTYCVQTLAAKTATVTEPKLVSLGTFKVTHYCPCAKCCGKSDGITATGTKATPGRTLAVDPRVIPYGAKVVLKYSDGTTEDYIAEDCGGSIKENRVDVFMGQHRAALHAGVRTAEVFIYE